ncbi:MAG TPA: 3-hydroxyacyl-ACP dehydratase FabZ family protein [Planctomycetaceae bacterium]|nr:3-hydroxyacyl-ACP dehydratase FabZ family protein [Planctomycetaceae bacterium]
MRFCLIDRITEIEEGKSISAIKNLSMAEEYLQDHFPGFPVIPGVLMVEAMVQTSAWLLRQKSDFRYSTILLKQAKAMKFNHFLEPGKTLTISSQLHSEEGQEATFKASGAIDGTSAVSARLVLKQFNLADQNPSLAGADQRSLEYLRGLFQQLWKQK